ncbi:hypothetical protein BB561_001788 [Smittium simulii]|uniref:Uncharacterized protein n=1 Tax=Smittium simulii TaxID=133385 RepID=A0A2T9YT70_9FUNG|nr:hypothetical protein BB561_001788 [Smittium simulii]
MSLTPTTPARMLLSQILGYISLFVSAIVTLPQVYENYLNMSGESVSEVMLWIWMVADLLNFTGAFLQKIIFTAIILAAYFVLTSVVLLFQLYYYRRYSKFQKIATISSDLGIPNTASAQGSPLNSPKPGLVSQYGAIPSSCSDDDSTINQPDSALSAPQSNSSCFFKIVACVASLGFIYYFYLYLKPLLNLTLTVTQMPQLDFWPQFYGYVSAVLYSGSRIPQIMKNYKNKSCEGLSIMMFVFTIISNVAFVGSFFAESTEIDRLIINLPWILGASISPFFDFIIFFQFYIYRK